MARPRVIYTPPSDAEVEQLVCEASQRMADETGDQGYLAPEIMWGLAAFIKLIGHIKAKQLNRAQEGDFDTPDKQSYPVGK